MTNNITSHTHSDTDHQGNNVALLMTVGGFILSIVGYLGYKLYYHVTEQDYPHRLITTSESESEKTRQRMYEIGNEVKQINATFQQYNTEAQATYNEFTNAKKSTYQQPSFFYQAESLSRNVSPSEVSIQLHQLMNEYPQLPNTKLTTETTREFLTELEEHHEKVLSLVEIVLPDLYASLNHLKQVNQSTFNPMNLR